MQTFPFTNTWLIYSLLITGIFKDNSAHTVGWYGLWIFSMSGWFPKDGTPENRYCDSGAADKPAVFENFKAWRCERGAELVFGGPIQFHNFMLLDNEKAGHDLVEVDGGYVDGCGAWGGIVVGHSDISADHDEDPSYCTGQGYIGPKLWSSTVKDVEFYNFDKDSCYALGTCSQCTGDTSSPAIEVSGLSFTDSPNKVSVKLIKHWLDNVNDNKVLLGDLAMGSFGLLQGSGWQFDWNGRKQSNPLE